MLIYLTFLLIMLVKILLQILLISVLIETSLLGLLPTQTQPQRIGLALVVDYADVQFDDAVSNIEDEDYLDPGSRGVFTSEEKYGIRKP